MKKLRLKDEGNLEQDAAITVTGFFHGTERFQLIPSEGLMLFILAVLTFSASHLCPEES